MNNAGLKKIAEAIALAALIAATTILELNGHSVDGLWLLIVFWVLF